MPIAEPKRALGAGAGSIDGSSGPPGRAINDDHISIRRHAEHQRPFHLIGIMDVDIGIDHDHGLWAQITGLRAALLPGQDMLDRPVIRSHCQVVRESQLMRGHRDD